MATTQKRAFQMMDPADVTIIGVDTDHRVGDHPLADERAKHIRAGKLDAHKITSVRRLGVVVPIAVRKEVFESEPDEDGKTTKTKHLVVVDGRHRAAWARAVNGEYAAAGKPEDKILIKVEIHDAEDDRAGDIMIAANEIRTDDDTVTKARKAARMIEVGGRAVADVAAVFGVGEAAVGRWIKLLKMSPKVLKAVQADKLPASVVQKAMKGMDLAAQEAALETLLADAAQEGRSPSFTRATALLGGSSSSEAPGNSAKPKVSINKLRRIGEFVAAGRLTDVDPGLMAVIAVLTNPDAEIPDLLAAALAKAEELAGADKAAAKAAKDAEGAGEREQKKQERAAAKAKEKATKLVAKEAAVVAKQEAVAKEAQEKVELARAKLKALKAGKPLPVDPAPEPEAASEPAPEPEAAPEAAPETEEAPGADGEGAITV